MPKTAVSTPSGKGPVNGVPNTAWRSGTLIASARPGRADSGTTIAVLSPPKKRMAFRLARVDREEVSIVRFEIARRGAVHAGQQVGWVFRSGSAVGDEADPVGVDVQLHRAHGAGADEGFGEARHGLVFAGRVDQIALLVDADPGAPHEDRVAHGRAPFGGVGDVRAGLAFAYDQRQGLAGAGGHKQE